MLNYVKYIQFQVWQENNVTAVLIQQKYSGPEQLVILYSVYRVGNGTSGVGCNLKK